MLQSVDDSHSSNTLTFLRVLMLSLLLLSDANVFVKCRVINQDFYHHQQQQLGDESEQDPDPSIIVYEDINGQGLGLELFLPFYEGSCVILPRSWYSKNISSLRFKHVNCVKLFSDQQCSGSEIVIQRSYRQNIININAHDGKGSKSVQKCFASNGKSSGYSGIPAAMETGFTGDREESAAAPSLVNTRGNLPYRHQKRLFPSISLPPTATLYEFANGEGLYVKLRADQCVNVPAALNNNIASVNTHGTCVRLYDEENCNGDSVQIQPNDPDASNLHFWEFIDTTSSVGPCLEYQQLGLQLINSFRSSHDAASLYLNETLNLRAQQEAESLAHQPELPSSDTFLDAGEMLSVVMVPTLMSSHHSKSLQSQIIREAINSWYNEKSNYNASDPISSAFTQLVWKSSSQLGFGLASYGRKVIVVAKFRPVGNLEGYFTENVVAP